MGFLEEQSIKEIREEFRCFDVDDDGIISMEDLLNFQKYFKEKDRVPELELVEFMNMFT